LNGATDGPHLAVVALQHGNEVYAFDTIRALHRILPGIEFAGRISLMPVANPIAFETNTRSTWIDALYGDGGNMNRIWPGARDGWITEQLVHALWSELLEGADMIVDLHDGIPQTLKISYGYVSAAPPVETFSDLDRFRLAFGAPILLRGPDIPGSLTTFASDQGKLTFAYEIGDFLGFESSDSTLEVLAGHEEEDLASGTALTVRGVFNLMKYAAMLDGGLILPSRSAIVSSETKVSPRGGGLLYSAVTAADIGRVLQSGEILGEVVDAFTLEVVETLTAPLAESLLVATTQTEPCVRVNPGDYAFYVADWSTVQWVDHSQ